MQQQNPIVRETPLTRYPGWVIREYANGMYDGASVKGPALTEGCDSFTGAVAKVRAAHGVR